jgi:hypothetical protein
LRPSSAWRFVLGAVQAPDGGEHLHARAIGARAAEGACRERGQRAAGGTIVIRIRWSVVPA